MLAIYALTSSADHAALEQNAMVDCSRAKSLSTLTLPIGGVVIHLFIFVCSSHQTFHTHTSTRVRTHSRTLP